MAASGLDKPTRPWFRGRREEGITIAQTRTEDGRTILAEIRRREIAELLYDRGAVTVAEVESRFGVSPMTARRDLDELERRGLLHRTHGGAVLPTSAHEDSFSRRLKAGVEAKRRLAEEAVALLVPGETVFIDSSTTSYFVVRRILETGVAATILTNSFPVMELVFDEGGPNVELIGTGGSLRRLTRSFVGPNAVRAVQAHFADRLFLSVKGLTANGMMTDADALEAEVKRAMIVQAGDATLLVDRSKLRVRGLSAIASVAEVSNVLAYGLTKAEADPLSAANPSLRVIDEGSGAARPPPRRT